MKLTVIAVLLYIEGCLCFLETPPVLRFLVLADWGGMPIHPYTTPVQTSVAEQMTSVARRDQVDFVVALGDNFYLYGVSNVDDPRFQVTYEDVYKDSSLQIPWYVIAGNHDYFGNVSGQIAYTKRSNRWNFPDYYQKVSKSIPGGRQLDIILLDTIQLCGNVYTLHGQPVGAADNASAEAQWTWIEHQLQQSQADYLIVGGHYPMYSVGLHGPTNCLIDRLNPLLDKYNVTAYIAGHDHNLQHIQMTLPSGDKMNHFTVGSGNFVDPDLTNLRSIPKEALKFFNAELLYFGGFSYFQVSQNDLKVQFIDGIGHVRYEYTLQPRK